jgi:hypothetical protein
LSLKIKILVTVISIIGITCANIYAFMPMKLEITSMFLDSPYPSGTNIAGFSWRSEFSQLDIMITNPSKTTTYEELNIILKPDQPVAAIVQSSGCPNIIIEANHNPTLHQKLQESATGKQMANPLVLVATNGGYRIRCGSLSPERSIKITMAVAGIKWNPKPPISNDSGIFDSDYALKVSISDGSSLWYGHQNGDVYETSTPVKILNVNGTFIAGVKNQNILLDIPVSILAIPINNSM